MHASTDSEPASSRMATTVAGCTKEGTERRPIFTSFQERYLLLDWSYNKMHTSHNAPTCARKSQVDMGNVVGRALWVQQCLRGIRYYSYEQLEELNVCGIVDKASVLIIN